MFPHQLRSDRDFPGVPLCQAAFRCAQSRSGPVSNLMGRGQRDSGSVGKGGRQTGNGGPPLAAAPQRVFRLVGSAGFLLPRLPLQDHLQPPPAPRDLLRPRPPPGLLQNQKSTRKSLIANNPHRNAQIQEDFSELSKEFHFHLMFTFLNLASKIFSKS